MTLDQQTQHWEAIAGMIFMPVVTLSRKPRTRFLMFEIVSQRDGISERDLRAEWRRRGEKNQNFTQIFEIVTKMGAIYKLNNLYHPNPNVTVV